MLKLIAAAPRSHGLSAGAVIAVSGLVGSYAAQGMNAVQWVGGLAAVCAAIGWAVMVRVA